MPSAIAPQRGLAGAFASCALATLILLASHPAPAGHGLAGLIRAAAGARLRDALVHGGFIAILAVLIVSVVFLSRRLGAERVPVVAALVSFAIGCGALMLSMIVDGFAVPAIAARFEGATDPSELRVAEALLILCGTLIRCLMPAGLAFQAAALAGWSAALASAGGRGRAVGMLGAATALFLGAAALLAPPSLAPHLLPGGIALQSVWYLALAALLARPAAPAAPAVPSRS
jgi:hypothetical protein